MDTTALREQWLHAIEKAADAAALAELDTRLFGAKGEVVELVRSVTTLPKEERPAFGKAANVLKQEVEQALAARREAFAAAALAQELAASDFDPTEPGPRVRRGALHPITIVQNELVDLFTSMGFQWQDGPEVESEYFNFDALNIPGDHPARESQDTFWLREQSGLGRNLLRTHTSPVQVRTMQRLTKHGFQPPLKVIVPGRCFRSETVDKSHEHTFYQMEGLVVDRVQRDGHGGDRGVSIANLIHTMKTCLRVILERDVQVRLRPGFFPFVEPGFELDVNCPFCSGKGCSVCKQSGWIEILPCGMVHPNVLRQGGIDPEEHTGFAFGMGLQRVVMLRYGIDDIRQFMGGDQRFLQQFPEVPR
ncbi:MAG: phenylalanine--tRNA ligase subunit alpha [Planctomycetes bacterium]|nr:phenylalanine--tRNA ligase subunit alpha [Planctomycetota bacterium]MCC7063921.1 phenylalanine--tRNA ligase subunit alpha [Planctomycetota bacterium]